MGSSKEGVTLTNCLVLQREEAPLTQTLGTFRLSCGRREPALEDAADGPLWAALTKDRSFASARQILSHNWKARWSTIRLENDLVKTLLDALAQHRNARLTWARPGTT